MQEEVLLREVCLVMYGIRVDGDAMRSSIQNPNGSGSARCTCLPLYKIEAIWSTNQDIL